MVSGRAQAQAAGGYRLAAAYPIPEAEPRMLASPISIKADRLRNEVVALEERPPGVAVLLPEGSVLRRFGADVLRVPTDVAVIYPSSVIGGAWDDGEKARYLVTEASLAKLHVFDAQGQHLRTVEGDWRPQAIVGIIGDQAERALVFDGRSRQVRAVDWDGSLQPTSVLGALAGLVGPILIASDGRINVLYDAGTRRLLWFDLAGKLEHEVFLDNDPDLVGVGEVTAMVSDGHAILLSTDAGLWAADWRGPFNQHAWYTRRLEAGVETQRFRSMAALSSSQSSPPTYRALEVFALGPEAPFLGRLHSTRGDDWTSLPTTHPQPVNAGCPMVWERPAHAWRLAMTTEDRPSVLLTNGVVLAWNGDVLSPQAQEIGYVDDWGIDAEGRILAMHEGRPVFFEQRVSGLDPRWTGIASRRYPDCLVSGIGFRPALSLRSTGAEPPLVWLRTSRSGRACNQLGGLRLSSPVCAEWDSRAGARRLLLDDSAETIQSPILSDVNLAKDGQRGALVDRLGGRVITFDLADSLDPTSSEGIDWSKAQRWPVPGRPDRAEWSPSGDLFVLTAEGWIWRLDGDGKVTAGWDAAGMAPAPRPTLVDLAVGADGKVYALDKYERRLLVFAPDDAPVAPPPPELPPPCSVEPSSAAEPGRLPVGRPITVTLALDGACGRTSDEHDVILLMQPPQLASLWTKDVFREAVDAFVGSLDLTKDRVGLTVFDASEQVMVPLGQDVAALRQAAETVAEMNASYSMRARPLLRVAEQFERDGRPGATRVVVLFTTGNFTRHWIVDRLAIDGESLRVAGIRVVVVCSSAGSAHLPALVAYQPEDLFIAPDGPTMRAVYAQLGRSFSARQLLRDLDLTVTLPPDMAYEEGSAQPPAVWDEARRTLRWRASSIGFGGWRAGFRLRPSLVGQRPVFTEARAAAIDGFGNAFPVSFPVPRVEVLPAPTATPTASATATHTVTPSASATSSPRPTPVGGRVYLPLLLREPACRPEQTPVDAVLVLDASGSMAGPKLSAAQGAARAFVAAMNLGRDRVGLVAFHRDAALLAPLGADAAALEAAIGGIQLGSGTRLDRGLAAGLAAFGPQARPGASRALILLTDGRHEGEGDEALAAARALGAADIVLHAVGLGEDADLPLLTRLTASPRRVYPAADAAELAAVYRAIAAGLPCPAGWTAR